MLIHCTVTYISYVVMTIGRIGLVKNKLVDGHQPGIGRHERSFNLLQFIGVTGPAGLSCVGQISGYQDHGRMGRLLVKLPGLAQMTDRTPYVFRIVILRVAFQLVVACQTGLFSSL
jgi:hypothetical protein